MHTKAGSGRDAFRFSRTGLTTMAPFAIPVVADDRIDRAREQRPGQKPGQPRGWVLQVEDMLGRYFAAGC